MPSYHEFISRTSTVGGQHQAPTLGQSEGGKLIDGRVVWINGPFGVGKTTVAELVAAQLPAGVLFDPEAIGYLLRRAVPVPTGDFQDVRAWRHLTAETLLAIVGEHLEAGGSVELVVPMSLTNSSYRTEIFEPLDRAGVRLDEFVLTARHEELERRIKDQVLFPDDVARDQAAREWRLAKLDAVTAALPTLTPPPCVVDTTAMTPEQVVATVTEAL